MLPLAPASVLRAALHGALISLALLMPATRASADDGLNRDLIVKYDQAQILRMPRPVAEVVIGNPSIADVTVQSNNLLVVTGKTFGVTNVIALDADRNVIQDQRVIVMRDEVRQVSLHRGAKRETYSCAQDCAPALMIGDDAAYFEQILKSSEKKTKFSESGAEVTGAN